MSGPYTLKDRKDKGKDKDTPQPGDDVIAYHKRLRAATASLAAAEAATAAAKAETKAAKEEAVKAKAETKMWHDMYDELLEAKTRSGR